MAGFQSPLNQGFRIRSGNEGVRCDFKSEVEKVLAVGEMRKGNSGGSLLDEILEGSLNLGSEFQIWVAKEGGTARDAT